LELGKPNFGLPKYEAKVKGKLKLDAMVISQEMVSRGVTAFFRTLLATFWQARS